MLKTDKESVLALAWGWAESFLLDSGIGLNDEGDPDERELASRRRDLDVRLGAVWDECVAAFNEKDEEDG